MAGNNNKHDNVYGAVIMAEPLRELTRLQVATAKNFVTNIVTSTGDRKQTLRWLSPRRGNLSLTAM